jgi:hypothetical protein
MLAKFDESCWQIQNLFKEQQQHLSAIPLPKAALAQHASSAITFDIPEQTVYSLGKPLPTMSKAMQAIEDKYKQLMEDFRRSTDSSS